MLKRVRTREHSDCLLCKYTDSQLLAFEINFCEHQGIVRLLGVKCTASSFNKLKRHSISNRKAAHLQLSSIWKFRFFNLPCKRNKDIAVLQMLWIRFKCTFTLVSLHKKTFLANCLLCHSQLVASKFRKCVSFMIKFFYGSQAKTIKKMNWLHENVRNAGEKEERERRKIGHLWW